jgi:hypothetical protein
MDVERGFVYMCGGTFVNILGRIMQYAWWVGVWGVYGCLDATCRHVGESR